MKLCLLGLFAVLSIGLVSCRKENSEKVNQDEIWTDYRVVYRSDLDTSFARVSFKHLNKGGESLKLSSKSELSINGVSSEYDGAYSWYQLMISGSANPVSFKYSDLDGNEFLNTIDILGVAEVESDLDTIYADSAFYLGWTGDVLAEGEFVNVIFDGALDNDLTVITQDTIGANGVFVSSTDLSKLTLGDFSLHFERWNEVQVNTTSAGGRGYGQYISKKKAVKFIN